MNKKNKILVGCLALLVALSMGYALFSETITINGTATAKGSFDVTATCQKGVPTELVNETTMGLYPEGGYENDTCTVNGNTVNFSVDLKYPSATRYFTITVTNTGMIDAVIEIVDGGIAPLFKNQIIKVYDNTTNSLYKTYTYSNLEEWKEAAQQYAHFTDDIWYDEGGLFFGKNKSGAISDSTNFNEFVTNNMAVVDVNAEKLYVRIKTGESVSFVINARWDDGATDNSRYSVVTASIDLPFQQIESSMTEPTE